jgi:hypothetical protein
MEKLMYLLGESPGRSQEQFGRALREEIAPAILRLRPCALALYLPATDVDIRSTFSVNTSSGLLAACISVWLDSVDQKTPLELILGGLRSDFAGFLVSESTPRDDPMDRAQLGRQAPGLAILAAFPKAAGVGERSFYANWSDHSALSVRIHPLVRYLRNAVLRPLTPEAPPWRGIVTELTASDDDLLDPGRFFPSDADRDEASEHLKSFVDVDALQMEIVREYVYKVEPWRSLRGEEA